MGKRENTSPEVRNRQDTAKARQKLWRTKPLDFLADAMTQGRIPVRNPAGKVVGHEEVDASTRIDIAKYLGGKLVGNARDPLDVNAELSGEGQIVLQLPVAPPGSRMVDVTPTPDQIEEAEHE